MGAVAAGLMLLLWASAASAANAATCEAYVSEAAAKAQWIRALGCGYNPDDPRWTTDRNVHARWCKAQPPTEVAQEAAHRRGLIKLCQICRAYATLAVAAASDNMKLNCGMSGPRWSTGADAHFGWCMKQRAPTDEKATDAVESYRTIAANLKKSLILETGARTQAVGVCKLTRTRTGHPPQR